MWLETNLKLNIMAKEKIEDFLTADELKEIKQLLLDLNTAKLKLADDFLAIEQVKDVLKIVREKLISNERQLIVKYGKDAKINLDTGKISKAQKEKILNKEKDAEN